MLHANVYCPHSFINRFSAFIVAPCPSIPIEDMFSIIELLILTVGLLFATESACIPIVPFFIIA